MVDTKTKKVLGRGWNKMPNGCEERFPWERGRVTLKTKYPYGTYITLCIWYSLAFQISLHSYIHYT